GLFVKRVVNRPGLDIYAVQPAKTVQNNINLDSENFQCDPISDRECSQKISNSTKISIDILKYNMKKLQFLWIKTFLYYLVASLILGLITIFSVRRIICGFNNK
ncbi:hypothetical protein, partial [Chitinolyticbacter albus]|uniref:hypothetical protein n=1 Tax=Chitinolyticbacter albus TaxID=2961951 RepID=UPI00210B3666